jgi:hypothetical protein
MKKLSFTINGEPEGSCAIFDFLLNEEMRSIKGGKNNSGNSNSTTSREEDEDNEENDDENDNGSSGSGHVPIFIVF